MPDMTITTDEVAQYDRAHLSTGAVGAGLSAQGALHATMHSPAASARTEAPSTMDALNSARERVEPYVEPLDRTMGVVERAHHLAEEGVRMEAAIRAPQLQGMAHAVDHTVPPPSPPMISAANVARADLPEVLSEVPNPGEVSASLRPYGSLIQGGSTALGVLGVGGGAVQAYHGYEHNDASEMVQGGTGALGSGLGLAGLGATPVGGAVMAFSGGYALGNTLNNGVGAIRGEMGATETRNDRGVGGGTHQERDARTASDLLADSTHSNLGDRFARFIAPHLPMCLGGG